MVDLDLNASHLQKMMSNWMGHVIKCRICLPNQGEINNLQGNVRSRQLGRWTRACLSVYRPEKRGTGRIFIPGRNSWTFCHPWVVKQKEMGGKCPKEKSLLNKAEPQRKEILVKWLFRGWKYTIAFHPSFVTENPNRMHRATCMENKEYFL